MPVIHASSHVDDKKRVAWVPIYMHTCGSVSILMVLRLAAPLGLLTPNKKFTLQPTWQKSETETHLFFMISVADSNALK